MENNFQIVFVSPLDLNDYPVMCNFFSWVNYGKCGTVADFDKKSLESLFFIFFLLTYLIVN